jgi:hypothetical protein
VQAETARKEASGIEQGVWIEAFNSTTPGLTAVPTAETEETPAQQFYYNRLMMERYGLIARGSAGAATGEGESAAATPAAKPSTPASTNEIATINVKCRGLNVKRFSPTANVELVYAVEKQLQANPIFDAKETKLSGEIENVDENAVSFSFGVTLKLKHPMKL